MLFRSAVVITGEPEASGLFDAKLVAHLCCDGLPKLIEHDVRILISGGTFLSWFHESPFNRDLQVMLRTREVHSYTWADAMWLKRGDNQKFHLIFRDAPLPRAPQKVTVTVTGDTTSTSTFEGEDNFGHDVQRDRKSTRLNSSH